MSTLREKGLVAALKWYEENAVAMEQHMHSQPSNTDAMAAIVTALSMDAGNRARTALEAPSPPQGDKYWELRARELRAKVEEYLALYNSMVPPLRYIAYTGLDESEIKLWREINDTLPEDALHDCSRVRWTNFLDAPPPKKERALLVGLTLSYAMTWNAIQFFWNEEHSSFGSYTYEDTKLLWNTLPDNVYFWADLSGTLPHPVHFRSTHCVHDWVDATNAHISNCKLCVKCHAIAPANNEELAALNAAREKTP